MIVSVYVLCALANLRVLAWAHLTGADPVAALLRQTNRLPAAGVVPGRRLIGSDNTTSPMFMVRALANLAVLAHAHLTGADRVAALLRREGARPSNRAMPGRRPPR